MTYSALVFIIIELIIEYIGKTSVQIQHQGTLRLVLKKAAIETDKKLIKISSLSLMSSPSSWYILQPKILFTKLVTENKL